MTPDSVETFNTKQKQFRDQLLEAQKKREERKYGPYNLTAPLLMMIGSTSPFHLPSLHLTWPDCRTESRSSKEG